MRLNDKKYQWNAYWNRIRKDIPPEEVPAFAGKYNTAQVFQGLKDWLN